MTLPSGLIWLVRELYAMHKAGKINDAEARWILVVAYGESTVQQLGRALGHHKK